MTTNMLVAVLVAASVTRDTVDAHLPTTPLRDLVPGIVDRYRVGGEFTGAWDGSYDPHTDPVNWRPCTSCAATGTAGLGEGPGRPCRACGDATLRGRSRGTVELPCDDWAPHPGDLIPLTRLLDPGWRFPVSYRRPSAAPGDVRGGASPDIWIGPRRSGTRSIVWPSLPMRDGAPTGEIPHEIQRELDLFRAGAPHRDPAHVDPDAWQVAIVDCHRTPEQDRRNLPIPGSLVMITDPAWLANDDPGELYVVQDDIHVPYYSLLRVGGDYGPAAPAHALTEIDPARITIAPLPGNPTSAMPGTAR